MQSNTTGKNQSIHANESGRAKMLAEKNKRIDQLMDETIDKWKKGRLSLKQQTRKGKLYKMKDLKPLAILKVKNMVESGELQYLIELNLNKYS